MMIRLRQATRDDSAKLFAWRNDPVTQAMSRSTSPVTEEDHRRWMMMHVDHGYPVHLVMIAINDSMPDLARAREIGTVRFDAWRSDNMHFDVGITIAPEWRGQGLAATVLSEACDYMDEFTLHAEVRRENVPSQRIFERCGFEQTGSDHDFIKYRRKP